MRVQTACFPGDVFGSAACDCGAQLRRRAAGDRARGPRRPALRHSGGAALAARRLQGARAARREARASPGASTSCATSASARRCSATLGVKDLRLLTNNPKKIAGLEGYGMCVVERVPLEMPATRHNMTLMRDKRDREGHLFSVDASHKETK